VRDLILVVGYRREQIFDYFGSGEKFGASINYVTQHKQLGTSDALSQARDAVSDAFLVLSGDKLIESSTISEFVNVQPQAALVKRVDNPYRHGIMDVADGLVQAIQEMPAQPRSNLASTRIYAFYGNDLVIVKIIDKALGSAMIGMIPAKFFYDITLYIDMIRFNIFFINTIIPDEGICHDYNLSGIGRVGQYLLIACHCRVENDLTGGIARSGKRCPIKMGTIFKIEYCFFHAWMGNKICYKN